MTLATARASHTPTKQTAQPTPQASAPPARAAVQTASHRPLLQTAQPALRLSTDAAVPMPSSLPAPALQAIRSPGAGDPLPPSVQGKLEGSLNVSLASVRVHTDAHAAAAAEGLGARAVTY